MTSTETENVDSRVGRLIDGRYRVEAILGQGGMGVVARARDTRLDRDVALKLLHPHAVGDAVARARMVREARAMAAFTHPAMVHVYDVGTTDDGGAYLAMELLDARTVRSLLGTAWPTADRLRALVDAARALGAVHAAGLVHRDVKPDNLMVRRDGRLVLLDFGIVRKTGPSGAAGPSTLTGPGALIGTLAYMSPEQAAGRELDGRSDQFSLAVTAFEVLTGAYPWEGASPGLEIISILTEPAPRASAHSASLSALDPVLGRALAKAPEDRWPSMEAFAAALEAVGPALREAPSPEELIPAGASTSAPLYLSVTARVPTPEISEEALAVTAEAPAARAIAPLDPSAPTPTNAAPRGGSRARRALGVAAAMGLAAAAWLGFARRPEAVDFSAGTGNVEARSAFRAGMTAWRGGNGEAAEREWERAATLDPSYGAPALWLAAEMGTARVLNARGPFKRATLNRGTLSGPNVGLHAALAPYLTSDIPDGASFIGALERLVQQYPSAGEITQLLGWYRINVTGPTPAVLADFDATLARDPSMVGALAGRGWVLSYLGRFDEAITTLDRCSRMSPAPVDCIMSLAGIQLRRGECAALQATAQRWRALEPEGNLPRLYLARARQGLGAPVEEVHELLQQAAELMPGERGKAQAEHSRWEEAMLDGRFEDAARAAQTYESMISRRTGRFVRVGARVSRIMTAQEMGDRDEAARLAEDTLRRFGSWEAEPGVDDEAISRDFEPFFLSVLVDLGRMTRKERAERRAAWLSAWRARTPAVYHPFVWVRGYVSDLAGDEDAKEALEAMPAAGVPPFLTGKFWAEAGLGKMFLATGSPARALPYLRIAANGCDGLDTPRTTVRASLWLGQVLQATGDKAGACKAWQAILDRWGKAKPRSVTAEEAQALAHAAGCREPPR